MLIALQTSLPPRHLLSSISHLLSRLSGKLCPSQLLCQSLQFQYRFPRLTRWTMAHALVKCGLHTTYMRVRQRFLENPFGTTYRKRRKQS